MDPRTTISKELARLTSTLKGAIGTPDLEGGGRLQPAKMPKGRRRKLAVQEPSEELEEEPEVEKSVPLFAKIVKADRRLVTSTVLRPEVTDGQGDIMSAAVIEKAAFDWLAAYGKKTTLGLQHNSFKKNENRFTLAESYIAPMDFAMGDDLVTKGTWLMTVKVLDDELWQKVKDGEITGFSIGGRATAQKVSEE